ncbi:winged helix-turn-helix transcriptional regulator [Clostridium autoethanogenum]|nr:winged helix-turn-helix transcriptional regulator [Clostridium autoethanogenum]
MNRDIIERIAYATIPPKVEYMPTDRGKSLENILTELCLWGKKYMNS